MRSSSTIRREPAGRAGRPRGGAPAPSFHLRLRTEQERADRHGRPLGIVTLRPADAAARGRALALVERLARRRLRATDWVGVVEGTGTSSIGLLLPFTPPAETERLAAAIGADSAARGVELEAEVQSHRPRPQGARARRRPASEPRPETGGESADVCWEPRGVPLLLARPLPRGKRVADVLLASVGLVVLAPLMGLIALAIRLSCGSPVIFRQWRTGLGFRRFQILKFRTMRPSNGSGWEEVQHLNEFHGPLFKSDNDPRVLALGKILRKASLDELPQLWNVLKGDMTLIGPRALSPETGAYQTWQLRRFDHTPGIACAWQAERRKDTDFEAWMRSDLAYLDARPTFWSDLALLFRIAWVVVLCRGSR
ncbi:MAG TPA: sugar transferase [Planctomycetota bacterium]